VGKQYAIWRLIDAKPGCADYMGVILAADENAAVEEAQEHYGIVPGEPLTAEPDEDDQGD
jgi:hypothetical protein